MNQQINLYLPEFRRKKDWLDLNNMVALIGGLVVVLALVSAVEYWDLSGLRAGLEQRQQERADLVAETNQLEASYGVQSEDASLRAEVNALEADLVNKEVLLGFLDGRNIGSTEGFSEFLADLARYHLAGLRLTGVNLSGGGNSIVLDGEVINAELVPLYLQNLRRGQSFTGKEFESLRISDAEVAEGELGYKVFNVATTN
jgi:hypothetical protein